MDKYHRSAVTNGSLWIEKIDQRSALARRYRDLLNGLYDELHAPGGDGLPLIEQAAAKRLAGVLTRLEIAEGKMVSGDATFDDIAYTALIKLATKLSYRLGLEPRVDELELRQMGRRRW